VILKYDIELANTRAKLARLEARYEALRNDTAEDGHVRELTLQSLKKYINQFKEELARSQTGPPARRLRRTLNDVELPNTRRKLSELQRRTRPTSTKPTTMKNCATCPGNR